MPQTQIPNDLINWLSTLPLNPNITQPDSLHLENGQLILQILKLLIENFNPTINTTNTLSNRVTSWTLIIQKLISLNIRISNEDKNKILNGDAEPIIRILFQLKELKTRLKKSNEVDISKIDPKKDFRNASSLLQLLIILLCKNFSITSKEAISLLSNQAKYLAHILAKGLKGDFLSVESFYHELIKAIPTIITLVKDKQSRDFLFKALKSGIISKSQKIAVLSFDLINQLITSYPIQLGADIFKEILINTAILGVRRHPIQIQKITTLMVKLWNLNQQTFDLISKNGQQDDSLPLYIQIYKIAVSKNLKDKVIKIRGFGQALQLCFQQIQKQKRIFLNISFINAVIREQFQIINQSLIQKLVNTFPKSRFKNKAHELHLLTFLFETLYLLGSKKNSFAPLLYKNLINLIPEIISSDDNQLYFNNLIRTIKDFPTIPMSIIIDTFSNAYQDQQQNINLNSSHIQLLKIISENQNLDMKSIMILLDLFTKILLNNFVYAQQIGSLIYQLVARYPDVELIHQIISKFIKIALAIFYANEKKIMPKRKGSPSKPMKESNQQILYRFKNITIYKVLNQIIELKIQAINQGVLPLIGYTVVQLRSISYQKNHLLINLLRYFGKPDEILKEFQPQQQQTQVLNPLKKNTLKNKSRLDNQQIVNKTEDQSAMMQYSERKRPENSLALSNNRMSQLITPKVIKGLQKYHNSYLKKIQKIQTQQKIKVEEITKKQNLKKSMQIKMLQQGLAIKNDQQIDLIFQFDSREKVQKLQRPNGFREIPYIDADLEEDRDIKALQYILKRYHKVLRFLYIKYSSCGKGTIKDFDQFAQKNQSIKASQLWKMFKQYNFQDYLNIYECQQIVKSVNYKINNKSDPLALDYSGFEKFMVQISNFMFSKPPKDLRNYPPSIQVEEMFRMFRQACEKTSTNTQLFDDPDTAYFNEGQVIKDLNRKLLDNPNHILPEGYKKIIENRIEFQYKVFLEAMTPSYRDVYEIVDEFLFETFNFHVIQPFSKIIIKAKARPTLFYTNQKKEKSESANRSRTRIDSDKIKYSSFLKTQVSRFPIKQRITATKVATVLQQILIAVECGHTQIGLKPENSFVKSKKERQEQLKRKQEQNQRKRRQRQQQLKKYVQQLKQQHTQKQKLQLERKKQQQQKKLKEEEQRKKNRQKELKAKLQQYELKKKQKQEAEKKEQQQKRQKQLQEQQRKKKEAEQIKRKVQQAKKRKQEEQAERKEREDSEKRQKKIYEQKLFREKQKLLKEKISDYKKAKQNKNNDQEEEQEDEEEVKAVDN